MLSIPALVFVVVFATVGGLLTISERRRARDWDRVLARFAALSAAEEPARNHTLTDLRKFEALSSLPWLNNLLVKSNWFYKTKLLLLQAGLNWTVGRYLLSAVACGAAAFLLVYARIHFVSAAALAGLCASSAPAAYVCRRRRTRFSAFERQLPQALDLVASAMRVGHGLSTAMSLSGKESPEPLAGEFRQCVEEQRLGLDLRIAMGHLAERVPLQDVRILATACVVQRETGGNLAEILERVAHVIRERFRMRQQIRVHTAQARLTGLILGVLPIGLGGVMSVLNPSEMRVLWTTPTGQKMTGLAAGLMVVGALLIRKIVRVKI